MKSCSVLSGVVSCGTDRLHLLALSVGTGARFFIVGNKMSTSRTHAKVCVVQVKWDSC